MSIQLFALVFALLNLIFLTIIYGILAYRRRNGKSDVRQSRVTFVISSFAVPILATVLFVISAVIAQHFFNHPIPVGKRGGGVFIILIVSVISSAIGMLLLLPRIKHKWDD